MGITVETDRNSKGTGRSDKARSKQIAINRMQKKEKKGFQVQGCEDQT